MVGVFLLGKQVQFFFVKIIRKFYMGKMQTFKYPYINGCALYGLNGDDSEVLIRCKLIS